MKIYTFEIRDMHQDGRLLYSIDIVGKNALQAEEYAMEYAKKQSMEGGEEVYALKVTRVPGSKEFETPRILEYLNH